MRGGMGSSPKIPPPAVSLPTPSPATTASTTIVNDAASAAEQAAKSSAGQSSTILTGPMGLATTNTNTGKTLLGG